MANQCEKRPGSRRPSSAKPTTTASVSTTCFHTAASLLIAADRSLQEVKDYLGRSSIRVTSDRYATCIRRRARAMADALDETFKNATPANLADFPRTSRGLAHLLNANKGRT